MARASTLDEVAAILERRGAASKERLRSGLVLLLDIPGTGTPVRRQHRYRVALRMWLNHGDAVKWPQESAAGGNSVDDDGELLTTTLRIDRVSLVNGLFYGVEGMHVGGIRRLEIAPHLAYGKNGLGERIPPGAVLTAELAILAEATER